MSFIEFRNKMDSFRVFSVTDIEKMFPDFLRLNLINWQKRGYVIKIRREWYCFTDQQIHGNLPWLAANLIYQPSYISLHTALSFYNLIPEAVYTTTSITTKKTNQFNTPVGNFIIQMGHAPTILSLTPGKLITFRLKSGKQQTIKVQYGMAQITRESTTIILDTHHE